MPKQEAPETIIWDTLILIKANIAKGMLQDMNPLQADLVIQALARAGYEVRNINA